MNFLFVRRAELKNDFSISLHHDERVLRLASSMDLKVGSIFRATVEGLGRGRGSVTRYFDGSLEAQIVFPDQQPITPAGSINLILALPRPKVFKRMLPGIVTMGVESVIIVNACGVHRNYFDTHWLEQPAIDRLRMLGLEQGGSSVYTRVVVRKQLRPFLEDELRAPDEDSVRLVCLPDADVSWRNAVIEGRKLWVAVGPETGWTAHEQELFSCAGFNGIGLGAEHLPCDVATFAALGVLKGLLQG